MAASAREELSPRAREIVSAARELLEDEGLDALSMRALADRLGMRAPSLYKHFADKQALEAVIVSEALIEFGETIDAAVAVADAEEPLLALGAAYRRFAHQHPHLYRLMTERPLQREQLLPGTEERGARPLRDAAGGDPDLARAVWAFAHGMTNLELNGRFPPGADLDAAWSRGLGAVLSGRRVTAPPALERPLQTERLTLRSATEADAEPTWRYRRLASVGEWLTSGAPDLDGYRAAFIAPARLATAIILVLGHDAGAPVIGDLMLRREDAWAQREVADRARGMQVEVGWALDPVHEGHGYATEAVRELLRYCFEELHVHRVIANCFADNDASARLMERVGMRRETYAVREALHRSGRWLDSLVYAMLEERPVADDLAFPPRMYQVADPQVVAQGGRALLKRRIRAHVSRTVLLLGVTSMLTDISSEMVTTILPLYLVYSLGMSPLQFGVIDGIQQGASSLVRVFGGFFADRRGRYKEVAVVGYGLSAFTRIALLVAGRSWSLIGGVIFLDRAGKGIRTAPRDALISLSTPEEDLGTAFGVHRALDTAGAMIGPVIAFAVLYAAPHGFHSIFVLSFCFALVGLAVLVLFVENRPERVDDAPARPLGARDVAALFALPGFALLTCIGFALAVATTSDGFIYLGLQNKLDFAARNLPLLYIATSLVYMLLAVPVGRVADRLGRSQVFIGGYLLLVVVYASIVLPSIGAAGTVLVVVALGTFYAATDGVLMALASGLLPAHARATGLSLLVTATSLGRLVASIAFGALWTLIGVHAAVIVFAVALTAIGAVSAIALTRSTRTSAA